MRAVPKMPELDDVNRLTDVAGIRDLDPAEVRRTLALILGVYRLGGPTFQKLVDAALDEPALLALAVDARLASVYYRCAGLPIEFGGGTLGGDVIDRIVHYRVRTVACTCRRNMVGFHRHFCTLAIARDDERSRIARDVRHLLMKVER